MGHKRDRHLALLAVTALLLVSRGLTVAAEEAEPPAPAEKRVPPLVQAVYVDTPPVIDGALDDPCWQQAARLEDFFLPDLDQPLPEKTTGLICVDDTAIYVAVICDDRTPEDIKAVETRRNGDISDDDCVDFGLDPWNLHETSYSFRVSARGTQCEDVPGGSATKIEWRGDWTAAAGRTAEGWQAEMAVPFSILRYPPDQTTFGLSIGRHFAQERVWASYPITGRAWDPTLAADLVGLHPPAIRPRPILMPYVTADMGDFVGRRFDTGLDVQYHMPSGLTALMAVNPDFKQIEDVVEPISFSYTERYLYDPRPFFATGQQMYFPREHLLYTRRIRDFDAGIKLFGTVGRDTIGLLDAITYGVENSFAAAWHHQLDPNSGSKLLLVSHRKAGEPGNFCYGLDAGHQWNNPRGFDTLWTVFYQSQTQGGPSGGSYAIGGQHERGSGELFYDWMFRVVTPDFDPALGYYYRQNSIGGALYLGEYSRYEKGALESRSWNLSTAYYPYLDGEGMLMSFFAPSHQWRWRSGRYLGIGFSRGQDYDQDSSDAFASLGWNSRDMHRRGGLFILDGVRAGGDYHYYSLDQGFHPSRNWSVHLATEYTRLEPPAEQAGHQYLTILTSSYDLTPEKCIAARGIWRDQGFTAYASYRQVVRRGMDAYVIVGDPDPARTGFASRVAIKLIWVL